MYDILNTISYSRVFFGGLKEFFQIITGRIRYRTFKCGYMPADHEGGFQHGIPSIQEVLEVKGSMIDPVNGACYPLPFATPVSGESVSVIANRTSVFVNVGECDRSKFRAVITIKYRV
jgi:hypothetical protein